MQQFLSTEREVVTYLYKFPCSFKLGGGGGGGGE